MTNLDYMTSQLGRFGFEGDDLQAILVANQILPNDVADILAVRKAIYKEVPLMLAGLQEISESGYTVKWNIAGIKAWYSVLAKELGLPDVLNPKPIMKFVGNRW